VTPDPWAINSGTAASRIADRRSSGDSGLALRVGVVVTPTP